MYAAHSWHLPLRCQLLPYLGQISHEPESIGQNLALVLASVLAVVLVLVVAVLVLASVLVVVLVLIVILILISVLVLIVHFRFLQSICTVFVVCRKASMPWTGCSIREKGGGNFWLKSAKSPKIYPWA